MTTQTRQNELTIIHNTALSSDARFKALRRLNESLCIDTTVSWIADLKEVVVSLRTVCKPAPRSGWENGSFVNELDTMTEKYAWWIDNAERSAAGKPRRPAAAYYAAVNKLRLYQNAEHA